MANRIGDVWKVIETLATFTKELERAHVEIKELRKDLHDLTLAVSELNGNVERERIRTVLTLDNQAKEIERMRESLNAKFEVLLAALDGKLSEFENAPTQVKKKRRRLNMADAS